MAASVHPAFQKLLEELKKQCDEIYKAYNGNQSQRPWMVPPAWEGDPLNIEAMKAPFDRDEPNANYEQELNTESGRIGICMGHKITIDYMGMQERAFRARHMTSIRGQAHAATTRQSHGEATGVHQGVVLQYVQDLLKAGQETS